MQKRRCVMHGMPGAEIASYYRCSQSMLMRLLPSLIEHSIDSTAGNMAGDP